MGIFPEHPCEYSVEFIRRMRNHPEITSLPSSRQVLSIPQLIIARYYRKGSVTPNDFIEISALTSFPENQKLAKKIAFEILFPNYDKNMIKSFFKDDQEFLEEKEEEILSAQDKSEMEKFQDLIDEIEGNQSVDTDQIQKLEKFLEELNQKRNEEPYKSALQFFNDDSELFKEKISSLEELIEEAKKRMLEKMNSLDPEDLKAGAKLGLNDLIQENSLREWEKLTSKALSNQDISKDLQKLLNSKNLDDFIQSMKYLNESGAISEQQFQDLKNQLENMIDNMDQLFQAAKTLGETPKFDLEKLLNKSLQNNSFDHNFNLTKSLDQYFGTNLRASMLDKLNQQSENMQSNIPLETLTKNAYPSKSWNSLFNKALQKAIQDASNQIKKNEAFKALSHQMLQLMNSCSNMHCSQKIAQKIPDLIKKTLESSETPQQLKNAVEFFRKTGMQPLPEDIEKIGKKLGMPEEEIFELIEPNYQLLKKLIEKNVKDFDRISNLMNQIKDQLNYERIKELTAKALSTNNKEALGALGNFNLADSLKASQSIGSTQGQDKLIACLTAGSGENLLKQWFIHRDSIPLESKQKVKEIVKKMLIDLGIYYARARLGSATMGPIPINIVRPYTVGDDFENIDLEETILNILEKGKKLDHINYDDFFVNETAKGLRSACFELDISGSMTGEKLSYMALTTTILLYSFQKDELGLCLFESNTHILKEIDKKVDIEKIADELLSIESKGGTVIETALDWAIQQFKKVSYSREKLNVLFTDAEIFDIEKAMEKLRILRSMRVDFIIVCPEASYNLDEAKKIAKISGGQLITVDNWENFPKKITDILNSKL